MIVLDEFDDLLGNESMPVRQQGGAVATAVLVVLYHRIRAWREENHRLAVRRKYGIPDTDKAPFNVAYATAQKHRKDDTRPTQANLQEPVQQPDTFTSAREQAHVPSSSTRQRHVQSSADPAYVPRNNTRTYGRSRPTSGFQNSNFGAHESSSKETPRSEAKSRDFTSKTQATSEPVNLEDVTYDVSAKDPEPIYLDSSMDISADSIPVPTETKRGAKRQASPVEDIINNGSISRKAGKRARRQSKKLQDIFRDDHEVNDFMDIDRVSHRGKKRDRTDAESTFGDDDSPTNEYSRRSRRQKRIPDDQEEPFFARGIKRSYEVESTVGSDDEQSNSGRSRMSSRKRGKRSDDAVSDTSMESVVVEPSCGGRRPGEEWIVNGIRYKVGFNGRRLRLALLKKRRSRFSMPKDSQHPDTQMQYVVVMEVWLNDDEYKAAEERGDVFIPEKDSNNVDVKAQFRAGKNLFYSTHQKLETLAKKAINTKAVITTIGLDSSPFDKLAANNNKRISIGQEPPSSPQVDSPVMRSSKSFSKWEKQDMEAAAMSRLRKKIEEERKAAQAEAKKVTFQIPDSSSSSSSSPAANASSLSITANSSNEGTPATSKSDGLAKPSLFIAGASATAPNSGSTEQAKSSSAPFSFGTKASSTDQSTSSAEKPASEKPSPFGTQQSTPANKPLFPFGASNASSGVSSAPGSGNQASEPAKPATVSNPFGNLAATNTPASSTGTPFSFGAKSTDQADKTSTAPTSGFAPVTGNAPATPSPFSQASKDSSGTSSGPSLLSRLGEKPAQSSTTSNTGTPAAPSPFPFNAPKPATDSADKPTDSTSTGSAAPKFNFGLGAKPASSETSTEAPKTTTATPSPFAAFGSNTTQTNTASPAAAKFSFGTKPAEATASPFAKPSETTSSTNNTSTPSTTTPFSFGNKTTTTSATPSPFGASSGTTNAFGSSTTNQSPFGAATKSFGSSPSPFAFGGAAKSDAITSSPFGTNTNSSTPSPFGAKPDASTPSPFGVKANTTAPSPFGASSAFGSSTKPAAFGSSGVSTFGTPSTTTAEIARSAFGSTPSSSTDASSGGDKPAAPKFQFGVSGGFKPSPFGSTTTNTTTPTSQPNTPATSGTTTNVFGSTNSAFSFGSKPATTPSPFGAAASGNAFSSGGAFKFGSQADGDKK